MEKRYRLASLNTFQQQQPKSRKQDKEGISQIPSSLSSDGGEAVTPLFPGSPNKSASNKEKVTSHDRESFETFDSNH